MSTATLGAPVDGDDFVDAARDVLRDSGGSAALDSLDWWDLTDQLDDLTCRLAVFALFRAQGHELVSTPALGAVLAQPYLALLEAAPGDLLGTIHRRSRRRGPTTLIVGDPADLAGRRALLDDGSGVVVCEVDRLDLRPVATPGRLAVHEVVAPDADSSVLDPESLAGPRAASLRLGRTAVAAELLGAAEGAVQMAVEYAAARHQFGHPIGTFQAVRHLLAWARTDTVAIAAVVRQAELLDHEAGPRFDEVVKAIAGRNALRACERSMQVLGGVAFTAELDHHVFHSRVLQLDALLGTSAELTHALGSWVREGHAPDFPHRALTALRAD